MGAVASSPHIFMNPHFWLLCCLFNWEGCYPWHVKQHGDREWSPCHPTDVPCPPSIAFPFKENKANCSQQVVDVTYRVKLAIKVRAAEGGPGRCGGWRPWIKESPDNPCETGFCWENCTKIMEKKIATGFRVLSLHRFLG